MKKKRFDEDIWLISKLYRGTYCDLNLAFWPEEDEQVVIKTVRSDVTKEEKERIEERLLKEASTLEEFWNNAFPKVYDIRKKEENDTLYLILEHFDGNSLRDYLNLYNDKSIEAGFLDNFLQQMSSALSYLHLKKNICHLDLTPENIMVDLDQNFHIIDFEESQLIGEKLKTHKVRGKQDYIAPEMLNPNENSTYTGASDIYSLGIVIKEIYDRTSGLKSSQKRYYQAIIRHCQARRPEIRPNAKTFLYPPSQSPFKEKLTTIKESITAKRNLWIVIASITCLVFLIKTFVSHNQKKRNVVPVVTTRSTKKIITRVPIVKKAPVKKRTIKRKKIKKKKTVKRQPVVTTINYQKLFNTYLKKYRPSIDSCIKKYAPKNTVYRYEVTIEPPLGSITQAKPLASPPRRLTYCLGPLLTQLNFPKRSKQPSVKIIQSFSLNIK